MTSRTHTPEDVQKIMEPWPDEPVGHIAGGVHPPQRTWVGLTDEERSGKRPFGSGLLFNSAEAQVWELAVDYAEAKLKEKNT